MNFSKLRHRVIFLSPTYMDVNSMHETVPRYTPYHPAKKISKMMFIFLMIRITMPC